MTERIQRSRAGSELEQAERQWPVGSRWQSYRTSTIRRVTGHSLSDFMFDGDGWPMVLVHYATGRSGIHRRVVEPLWRKYARWPA